MSEKVLTDFEIVQILNTDRPKTGWAYGLCREVEAKVVSRCRAQGCNTSENITQAAANKAAEEATLKHLRSAVESMPQRTVQGCKYVHLDSVLAEICQLEIIAADRAARPVANKAEVEQTCVCGSPATLGSVHRTDGPCYVAESTPPATTGASTVLTDERIDNIFMSLDGLKVNPSQCLADWDRERRIAFAREIEREVAAQAGQEKNK